MNTLRKSVTEYLAMRRSLGFKMYHAEAALFKFVSFMEEKGASHIQTSLALEWAQQTSSVRVRPVIPVVEIEVGKVI